MHFFKFLQVGPISCSDCLDAHGVPTIVSPPNVDEPKGLKVWLFRRQFHLGEDARSTEEGVDM